MSEYKGYKLVDKIMLVCQDPQNEWKRPNDCQWDYFAYLVDPNNKSQLESARRWGKTIYYGEFDKQTHTYPDRKDYPAVEFLFDNTGFEFKVLDCAENSSQGGKLSFWNCLVTKDSKTFKIGIAAEMLLDLLRDGDFVKGTCQNSVAFATRNGNVGVVVEGGETYKKAQKDMSTRAEMKKTTTKYLLGDNIKTLTMDDIYLDEWYYNAELVYIGGYCSWRAPWKDRYEFHIYKKPRKCHLTISRTSVPEENTLSSIFEKKITWIDVDKGKKKSRSMGNAPVIVDMTSEQMTACVREQFSCADKIFEESAERVKKYGSDVTGAIIDNVRKSLFATFRGKQNEFPVDPQIIKALEIAGIRIIREDA